jgi:hypothetical protein
MAFVGAARLSDLSLVPGHVEDVVDDLEDDSELGREAPERHCGRSAQAFERKHGADRRRDQGARLELVQVAKLDPRIARHVEVLAADHPPHAGGVDDLADRGEHVGRFAALLREREPKRLGEEAVAGQDGDVLPEGDVARGLPTAQVVVVHRREVVVDQRVRMDHLDRRAEREDLGRRTPEGLGCGEGEHRPDALATGEQRVAHGLLEPRGAGLAREAKPVEVRVDLLLEPDRIGRRLRAAQRRRSWPSASPAERVRASISAPICWARSAQRSTRSAASSASTASARSLSATASSSAARSSSVGGSFVTPRPPLAGPIRGCR